METSRSYGNLYVVVPFDTTIIAESNRDDFWDITNNKFGFNLSFLNMSFDLFCNENPKDIKKWLNSSISNFFEDIYSIKNKKSDYIYLFCLIQSFLYKKNINVYSISNYAYDEEIGKLIDKIKSDNKNLNYTLYDALNYTLSPKNLNITTTYYSNLLLDDDQEVWMDKDAVLINLAYTDLLN